jgi:hypothetical protein
MTPGPNRTGVVFYQDWAIMDQADCGLHEYDCRRGAADMNNKHFVIWNMNFMRDVRKLMMPVFSD